MTTARIRRAYADDVRAIADRIEQGATSRRVVTMTAEGHVIDVHLPPDYPVAPGGVYYGSDQ